MTKNEVLMLVRRETGRAANEDTPVDDLGMDSLDFLHLIQVLEGAAEREIPFERFAEIKRLTIGDLARELA